MVSLEEQVPRIRLIWMHTSVVGKGDSKATLTAYCMFQFIGCHHTLSSLFKEAIKSFGSMHFLLRLIKFLKWASASALGFDLIKLVVFK